MRLSLPFVILASGLFASPALATSPTLVPALALDMINNGAVVTDQDRIFVSIQRLRGKPDPEVAEIVDGRPVPYPTADWNSWQPGKDGSQRFVQVNSIHLDAEGLLWVVDKGSAGNGGSDPTLQPKLICIDLADDQILRVYPLRDVATGQSFINDVRFKGNTAYLTDAGQPGLIVLDLRDGTARRVLDGDPSTIAKGPWLSNGKPLATPEGQQIVVHADQLELSPIGDWLYYQPATGPMSRIATSYLDDRALSAAELARHVEPFAKTVSTGGTAMADDGTIYASDIEHQRLIAIKPDGSITPLLSDARLVQMDAMAIDKSGFLWIPATQLNRAAPLNGGIDAMHWPVVTYKLKIEGHRAKH